MDTIKLEKVYVPTLRDPLNLMTPGRSRSVHALALAKPSTVMEYVLQVAAECKATAVLVASAVVTKLISLGRSFFKFLKKDFLKKEGVPLKGLVIYKGTKGLGKLVKRGI